MRRASDAIRAELEACRKDGLLKPEDVVARARRAQSALHACFTWDDGEAAAQYRLIEARNLIRVHVIYEVEDHGPMPVYVSLTSDRVQHGGGYRALADVLSDADLYKQMMRDAFTQLNNMQQKYRRIRELEPVWKAVAAAEAVQVDHAA